jgi:hypothetical protein
MLLGKYMDRIKYVKCDESPAACKDAGVTGVPSWDIRGERLVGYQRFPALYHAVVDMLPKPVGSAPSHKE